MSVAEDARLVRGGGQPRRVSTAKGAACIYLESWHADIEEFLELKNNTGDERTARHNLNLANWVPDIFMKRVEEDGLWSLFDPKAMPSLDRFATAKLFEKVYTQAEAEGSKTVRPPKPKAHAIYMGA